MNSGMNTHNEMNPAQRSAKDWLPRVHGQITLADAEYDFLRVLHDVCPNEGVNLHAFINKALLLL